MKIKIFRAGKNTNRFKKNQKVWVILDCKHHAFIKFRYRGCGRYVEGTISKWQNSSAGSKWNNTIGEGGFSEKDIDVLFARRLGYFNYNEVQNAD